VAYPTDSGLLASAVRRIVATGRRIQGAGGATRTKVRDRSRAAGKRAHDLSNGPSRILTECVIVYTYTDDGRPNHLVGPFDSRQDAVEWVEEHASPNELWDVAPLKEPSL
jgi:hypothetical protein